MKKEKSINVWECVCDICGHVWETRTSRIPKVCAKCTNPNWDRKSEAEPKEKLVSGIDRFGNPCIKREVISSEPVDFSILGTASEAEIAERTVDYNPTDFEV